MRFDIITIFPKIFDSYFNESIIKRAQEKKLVNIHVHDLRDYVKPKKSLPARMHSFRRVDDKPFGGGPGMVMQVEPIVRAVSKIANNLPKADRSRAGKLKPLILITSAGGKQFDSSLSIKYSKEKQIIIIAGHYEGIDNRIKKIFKDMRLRIMEVSVGPYVLTGGELPAMVMIDSIARHIHGVLGKAESLEESRFGVGTPTYTRPETFIFKNKKYFVPQVLLSGNHKKIIEWRKSHNS